MPLRLFLLFPVLLSGCVQVGFDPDKPLKIDATVTLKVERELDDYFNDLDAASTTIETDGSTPGN